MTNQMGGMNLSGPPFRGQPPMVSTAFTIYVMYSYSESLYCFEFKIFALKTEAFVTFKRLQYPTATVNV